MWIDRGSKRWSKSFTHGDDHGQCIPLSNAALLIPCSTGILMPMLAGILGGLGLFLLGMILLTDGLKALGGHALQHILKKFISGPVSGVGWGAAVTALVQSSSATTLTTIGFVSAGLLTFPQAIGVIFGANLGTTSTGWIVSQLGFKVSMGSFAPPIVLAGVVIRLLFKGRGPHIGQALAGFGLLFIGIDMLQMGMSELSERMDPSTLPGFASAGGMGSRLILVGFGALMTVVMQSSSASMAATLAAVVSGAIGYEQAAALIIGQNIGTTPKAIAVAIGAPIPAKRTVMAHVLFNVLTAGVAFFGLPLLLAGVNWVAHALGSDDAPTRLALFHTAFNVLGVALLLPVVWPFARMIERLLPEKTPRPTRFLGPAVAEVGPVALEAARRSLALVLAETAETTKGVLTQGELTRKQRASLGEARAAIDEARRFVHRLARAELHASETDRQAALMHATDHLDRLHELLLDPPLTRAGEPALMDDALRHPIGEVCSTLGPLAERARASADEGREGCAFTEQVEAIEVRSKALAQLRKSERAATLVQAAQGKLDPVEAVGRVDAVVWLDSVIYHTWRSAHYLDEKLTGERPAGSIDRDQSARTR